VGQVLGAVKLQVAALIDEQDGDFVFAHSGELGQARIHEIEDILENVAVVEFRRGIPDDVVQDARKLFHDALLTEV